MAMLAGGWVLSQGFGIVRACLVGDGRVSGLGGGCERARLPGIMA
jgi:hypothetical protein